MEPGAQTGPSMLGAETPDPIHDNSDPEDSSRASGAVWVGLGSACSRGGGQEWQCPPLAPMPLPVPHWGLALCGGSACLPFSITRGFLLRSGGRSTSKEGLCIFGGGQMGCGGALGRLRSCAWPHWPELGLPGLSCLCFSPPERIWVIRPPQAASPGPVCGARPCPVASHFSRGKHGPTGGPTRPVTALKVGARRPTRNGMEGKR